MIVCDPDAGRKPPGYSGVVPLVSHKTDGHPPPSSAKPKVHSLLHRPLLLGHGEAIGDKKVIKYPLHFRIDGFTMRPSEVDYRQQMYTVHIFGCRRAHDAASPFMQAMRLQPISILVEGAQ